MSTSPKVDLLPASWMPRIDELASELRAEGKLYPLPAGQCWLLDVIATGPRSVEYVCIPAGANEGLSAGARGRLSACQGVPVVVRLSEGDGRFMEILDQRDGALHALTAPLTVEQQRMDLQRSNEVYRKLYTLLAGGARLPAGFPTEMLVLEQRLRRALLASPEADRSLDIDVREGLELIGEILAHLGHQPGTGGAA